MTGFAVCLNYAMYTCTGATYLTICITANAAVLFPTTKTEIVVYKYDGSVFACLAQVPNETEAAQEDHMPTILVDHVKGSYRTRIETQALQYLWENMKEKAGFKLRGAPPEPEPEPEPEPQEEDDDLYGEEEDEEEEEEEEEEDDEDQADSDREDKH